MKLLARGPSSPHYLTVLIGRDRNGNWTAREENGMFGGVFVKPACALKYALFESGRRSERLVEISLVSELDIFPNDNLVSRKCTSAEKLPP